MAACRASADREAGPAATFRIEPLRPVEELRAAALAAAPPPADSGALPPDLVELRALDSTIHYDIRYATADNFMGVPFYDTALAFLQRPAAEALVRAHRRLAARGYGLLIHDAYRPWYVTRMFWDATPDSLKRFVADPAQGSRHNRGAAVDLSLYRLDTGRPVVMPSGYDEFTARAYPDYRGGTAEQRRRRDLLRAALEAQGFTVYQFEWWHFDFRGWDRYPVLNVPLRTVRSGEPPGGPGH
jgi:D-alanyl-D-alanine dipeptidase